MYPSASIIKKNQFDYGYAHLASPGLTSVSQTKFELIKVDVLQA